MDNEHKLDELHDLAADNAVLLAECWAWRNAWDTSEWREARRLRAENEKRGLK